MERAGAAPWKIDRQRRWLAVDNQWNTGMKNEQAGHLRARPPVLRNVAYFSEVLMLSKLVLSCLPTP